jgi:hypothetical protein
MEETVVALSVEEAQLKKKQIEQELFASLYALQEVTGCRITGVTLSYNYLANPVVIKGVEITIVL